MIGKQLMNVIHAREYGKGKPTSKVIYIENILEDDGTVRKNVVVEEDPVYTFYVTKKDFKLGPNDPAVTFIEKDKVTAIPISYEDMNYEIARLTGQMVFYNDCMSNGQWKKLRNLHIDKNLHLCDMNLVDFKIRQWLEENEKKKTLIPIQKAFFDIEVDGMGYDGFPFPEEAPCPVNLISYLYQPTMTLHSFILENEENKSQQKFLDYLEKNLEAFKQKTLVEMNDNGEDSKKFKPVSDIKFHIYSDEIELITDFFKLVHRDKPDFLGA